MDFLSNTTGWLLPVWILGAPLIAAVINLMQTPKADSTRDGAYRDDPRSDTAGMRAGADR